MPHGKFPVRIETERLGFERLHSGAVDVAGLQEFFARDGWQGRATEHMPWFRFEGNEDVAAFVEHAERRWDDGESARYLLRSRTDDELLGTAAFTPDWDKRLAGSDVVLAPEYWGRGFGSERASVFVELAFDHYDFEVYATTCAVDNDRSRRMIEKIVDRYGGRYEGRLRQFGSKHPDGTVTDQHRFSITRDEYEAAREEIDPVVATVEW